MTAALFAKEGGGTQQSKGSALFLVETGPVWLKQKRWGFRYNLKRKSAYLQNTYTEGREACLQVPDSTLSHVHLSMICEIYRTKQQFEFSAGLL